MVLAELPSETWALIAEHLKRETPPPGTKANWNDHLHQQDLVNLLQVSKDLYTVAAPLLYREPVVQNMGLLLRGIEKPVPVDVDQPNFENDLDLTKKQVPYHKIHFLNQVRRLYPVHHSSRNIGHPFMMTVKGQVMPGECGLSMCRAEDCKEVVVDTLARADVEGWALALDTLRLAGKVKGSHKYFKQLKSLAVGTWDDGRWESYQFKNIDIPHALKDFGLHIGNNFGMVYKHYTSLDRVLFVIACRLQQQSMTTCMTGREWSFTDYLPPRFGIVHGSTDLRSLVRGNQRHYISIMTLLTMPEALKSGVDLAHLTIKFTDLEKVEVVLRQNPVYIPTCIKVSASLAQGTPECLEICIIPEIDGDEEHVRLAQEIGEAIERFQESVEGLKRMKGLSYTFKCFVGDDIPACPCCGSRR